MTMERQITGGNSRRIGSLVNRANAIVRAIAPLWLTQLVLRLGLAVPFWR